MYGFGDWSVSVVSSGMDMFVEWFGSSSGM